MQRTIERLVASFMIHFLRSRLLSRLRRPVGRFNTELLGVLRVQPLPAAELHGLAADDASNRLTREEPLKDVEADVPARGAPRDVAAIDVVPQRQARAATKGFEFPPDIVATPVVLKHLGSIGSRHCCFGNVRRGRSHLSFTVVPTLPRLPSASKGAHSRRCAGSVSACQTFAGEWRSSLTRMSVHFSPPFRS